MNVLPAATLVRSGMVTSATNVARLLHDGVTLASARVGVADGVPVGVAAVTVAVAVGPSVGTGVALAGGGTYCRSRPKLTLDRCSPWVTATCTPAGASPAPPSGNVQLPPPKPAFCTAPGSTVTQYSAW